MKLLIAGLSHKTAPIEVREQLAIAEQSLPEALRELQKLGASEAVILSTCNRVEIAVTVHDTARPAEIIDRFLAAWKGSVTPWDKHLYRLESRDAIRHAFRVASSLDSMVVGEPQILGQLKDAYRIAQSEGSVGGLLENVLTRAFSVAKRVRSETGIGQMAVSISYAAVEVARRIFGSRDDQTVLIIGSGKMGELAARHLRRSGAKRILVANRTRERAEELARHFDGQAVDYTRLTEILPEVDIVIASSAAPHYVLTRDDMQRAIAARRNKPMYLIDIAVPRNIDPEVNKLDNVYLYDIDDLGKVVSANIKEREKQAGDAEIIVADEVERMMARLREQEVTPTIVSLQEQLEAIRAAEVARVRRRLPPMPPEQLRAIEDQMEAMSKSIVNKIAHGPISELRRNAGDPEGVGVIDTIRKVFHLQD